LKERKRERERERERMKKNAIVGKMIEKKEKDIK